MSDYKPAPLHQLWGLDDVAYYYYQAIIHKSAPIAKQVLGWIGDRRAKNNNADFVSGGMVYNLNRMAKKMQDICDAKDN